MKKMSTLFKKDPNDLSRVIEGKYNEENLWVFDEGVRAYQKHDGTACAIINGELYKRYDAKLPKGKKLKKIGYYIDSLDIGIEVSKISNKKFENNKLTDVIIGFGKHPITNSDSVILSENGYIDARQVRPTDLKLLSNYYKDIPLYAVPCQEPDVISGHYPHWVKCDRNNPSDKYHWKAWDDLVQTSNFTRTPIKDGTYELLGEKIQGNPERVARYLLMSHKNHEHEDIGSILNNPKEYMRNLDIEGIVFHHPDGRMCKIRKKDFGMDRNK